MADATIKLKRHEKDLLARLLVHEIKELEDGSEYGLQAVTKPFCLDALWSLLEATCSVTFMTEKSQRAKAKAAAQETTNA